ncbi:MAG: alpha/beta hydrolase [Clostridiales bacterium]|nr:alpha/beta hydrolase [Clostridiales bacterium]
MLDLKYPVLMVHGMGFRDRKHLCYWGRIPKVLENAGCRVFFGDQDSNGSIEDNGRFLAEHIRKIASENNIERFNVIAHCKGGLDMRYAISSEGAGDLVASLSTISTPHNGSVTVDKLLRFPDPLVKLGCKACDIWWKILGDKKPGTYDTIHSFTTAAVAKFNEDNPDNEDIYYQSFAFTFSSAFSDFFLWISHLVVKMFEGENDGLLAPRAVKWTNFRGVYTGATKRGISHCDEVDMRRMPLTRKKAEGITDITDFYVELVSELEQMGY